MKVAGSNLQCCKCKYWRAPKDLVGGKPMCEPCRRSFVTVCHNAIKQYCDEMAKKKIITPPSNPGKIILP